VFSFGTDSIWIDELYYYCYWYLECSSCVHTATYILKFIEFFFLFIFFIGRYLSILLKVDHETLMHPYETLLADVMYDAMHMQCLINAA
jgi:hypothetical protein